MTERKKVFGILFLISAAILTIFNVFENTNAIGGELSGFWCLFIISIILAMEGIFFIVSKATDKFGISVDNKIAGLMIGTVFVTAITEILKQFKDSPHLFVIGIIGALIPFILIGFVMINRWMVKQLNETEE